MRIKVEVTINKEPSKEVLKEVTNTIRESLKELHPDNLIWVAVEPRGI